MPSNARVLRCKVHDTGRDAIKAYMADGLLIQDSETYNTGVRDSSNAEGIDVMASIPATSDASAYGAIIRHNYIHNVATYGVYLKGGTRRGLIETNAGLMVLLSNPGKPPIEVLHEGGCRRQRIAKELRGDRSREKPKQALPAGPENFSSLV